LALNLPFDPKVTSTNKFASGNFAAGKIRVKSLLQRSIALSITGTATIANKSISLGRNSGRERQRESGSEMESGTLRNAALGLSFKLFNQFDFEAEVARASNLKHCAMTKRDENIEFM
jgi:hypothetical protein